MPKRLRLRPAPPILGKNMHILAGHQRLDFAKRYTKHGTILAAGCGEGAFAIWAKKHNAQNDVYAIDINDPGEEFHTHPVEFKKVSLEDYRTTKKFDTIFMMEIIEHLEEPEKIIEKYFKMLKDDGRMLITTPYVSDWDWEEDHIWRWDLENFKEMIFKIDAQSTIWKDNIFLYAVMIREID